MGSNVVVLASLMRATDPGPSDLAHLDQAAADWTETFALFGLDLHDPEVAAAAFVVARIFFERLGQSYADPVEMLQVLTGRIVEAATAIATFVS